MLMACMTLDPQFLQTMPIFVNGYWRQTQDYFRNPLPIYFKYCLWSIINESKFRSPFNAIRATPPAYLSVHLTPSRSTSFPLKVSLFWRFRLPSALSIIYGLVILSFLTQSFNWKYLWSFAPVFAAEHEQAFPNTKGHNLASVYRVVEWPDLLSLVDYHLISFKQGSRYTNRKVASYLILRLEVEAISSRAFWYDMLYRIKTASRTNKIVISTLLCIGTLWTPRSLGKIWKRNKRIVSPAPFSLP